MRSIRSSRWVAPSWNLFSQVGQGSYGYPWVSKSCAPYLMAKMDKLCKTISQILIQTHVRLFVKRGCYFESIRRSKSISLPIFLPATHIYIIIFNIDININITVQLTCLAASGRCDSALVGRGWWDVLIMNS